MYVKLIYYDRKTEDVCTNINKAIKHFGGNKNMAISLFSRINALISAETIKDICAQPQFHFHKLFNRGRNKNLEGYFAIDVKGRADKWRIILEPLDENELPYKQCNIDTIASKVRVVGIKEVSNHYE